MKTKEWEPTMTKEAFITERLVENKTIFLKKYDAIEQEITVSHREIVQDVQRIKRNILQRWLLVARVFISIILSMPILGFFVVIALYKTATAHVLDTYLRKTIREHDLNDIVPENEQLTQDETYYAERWGYKSELHHVVTEDGYILKMYRIFKKDTNPQGRKPVLIGHGLFQCSGAFVLNEEKSLAFMLIDQGYDVWVGNNRSIAGLEHVSLSFKDPEYWNWGLKELGLYDFTSMIEHVKMITGFSKVAYIGHSQGNAQAFIALSLKPELSENLSCFIALAPAVFAGHLIKRFPLCLLINLSDWAYTVIFGVEAFLPIMSYAQTIVEPKLFCFLAYSMFSYLFDWWDHHWVRRRKNKYFQFTPRPVSAKLIADWIAGWGRRSICLYVEKEKEPVDTKVPLTIFYGTHDYIVNGERFVRTFPGYEKHGLKDHEQPPHEESKVSFPMLDLVHVERIEGYEHMDTIWGHDNHKTTYPIVLENLEKAKW